ncbi:MAG TPA: hypothetical protein VGP72_18915 [Planctomycetota bacterium]
MRTCLLFFIVVSAFLGPRCAICGDLDLLQFANAAEERHEHTPPSNCHAHVVSSAVTAAIPAVDQPSADEILTPVIAECLPVVLSDVPLSAASLASHHPPALRPATVLRC